MHKCATILPHPDFFRVARFYFILLDQFYVQKVLEMGSTTKSCYIETKDWI
jgi:hypothetical protein